VQTAKLTWMSGQIIMSTKKTVIVNLPKCYHCIGYPLRSTWSILQHRTILPWHKQLASRPGHRAIFLIIHPKNCYCVKDKCTHALSACQDKIVEPPGKLNVPVCYISCHSRCDEALLQDRTVLLHKQLASTEAELNVRKKDLYTQKKPVIAISCP